MIARTCKPNWPPAWFQIHRALGVRSASPLMAPHGTHGNHLVMAPTPPFPFYLGQLFPSDDPHGSGLADRVKSLEGPLHQGLTACSILCQM
jgi:hypothetical protein